MWASESTIIPTRPFTNSSTLSCSFLAKAPGEMSPSSYIALMNSSVPTTSALVRSGWPSFSMLLPDAQTHDITSFWMPFGDSSDSGRTQPYWFLDASVSLRAASTNSVRFDGMPSTPAAFRRSRLTNTG